MELLTPSLGLIIWTGLALVNLLLFCIAIIKLARQSSLSDATKITWLLAIFFVPIAGSLLFLQSRNPSQTAK